MIDVVPGQLVLLEPFSVMWRDSRLSEYLSRTGKTGIICLVVGTHLVSYNNWRPILIVSPDVGLVYTSDDLVNVVSP
jgi:hypothetical protein